MLNLQKNYLEKYQQIYSENPQWNQIQYKLQLNLGNASANLTKVYSVFNPHLNTQFEKQNKGYVISDAFVNTNDKGSNRIQRVCQKGFQFPASGTGLEFNIGQVSVDPLNPNQHQLLLVKICPKRSYPCFEKDLNNHPQICPQGFQSIYYVDNNQKDGIYRHRFRLFKKNQVVPMYVIQFSFNQEHEKAFKDIICEDCQNEVASIFCATEKIYFCKKCDYSHHKNKLWAKHDRNKLSERPILDFGECKNHPKNKNQLFCQTCSFSMCMACKIYGDHSDQSTGKHQIFKIEDYYVGSLEELDKIDPHLDKRRYQLEKLLCYVDDQINAINDKTAKLQKELKMLFEKALTQLETISKFKLSILMADQLEIKRQYDYLQWMQSFLMYEKTVLPPNDFLIAWTKHERHRKEVLNISNIPSLTQVEPNISIIGKISIEQTFEEDEQEKNKAMNKNLQKFNKSMGGKGTGSKTIEPKLEKFRKKLSYLHNDPQ